MSPVEIGILGFVMLILLLFAGINIGVVMGIVGFLGMAYVSGWNVALMVLKTVPFTTFADYSFSVIPLFLLMGMVCFY